MPKLKCFAIKCSKNRRKGAEYEPCNGVMLLQPVQGVQMDFVCRCDKCRVFFHATHVGGIYKLKEIDKNDIEFVVLPYEIEETIHVDGSPGR